MRRLVLIGLFCFVSTFKSYGNSLPSSSSSPMSSTIKSSSTIEAMKPLDKSVSGPTASKPSTKPVTLPPIKPPPPLVPQTAHYFHPGILVFRNGKWEGSDHLLNLTNQIGVYATILKPENDSLELTVDQVRKQVEVIFEQANIKPTTLAATGQPPLPAFEMEILVYPVSGGYVACCVGRLFESVNLARFTLDSSMAFQAITWEKQTLIVGPKEKFIEQLTHSIQDISIAFVDRFQAYEKLKQGTN